MQRFFKFGVVSLTALLVETNAYSAGYVCNETIEYTSCNPGHYLSYNNAYNATPTVGNTCAECPAGSSCAGGTAAPAQCAYGEYSDTGSSICSACPTPSEHLTTAFPEKFYALDANGNKMQNITIERAVSAPYGEIGDKSKCNVIYTLKTPAGAAIIESVKYDSVTNTYEVPDTHNIYLVSINPGFYAETRLHDEYCIHGTRQYYKYGRQCKPGAYCPGYTTIPLCSDTEHVYTENDTLGVFACDTNSYQSNPGQSSCEQCPSVTDATNTEIIGITQTMGATDIKQCMIPAGTTFKNIKGTYKFTDDCAYSE